MAGVDDGANNGVKVEVTSGSVEISAIFLRHNYPDVKIVHLDLNTKNPDVSMAFGDGEAELLMRRPDSTDDTRVVITLEGEAAAGNWVAHETSSRYSVEVFFYQTGSRCMALWDSIVATDESTDSEGR